MLNINPHHPRPTHLTPSLPAFLSPLFAHVHIKYRTSEQVDRQGSQCQTKTMLCWTGWADTPVNLFPTNPRPCHWCPPPRLLAAQYYLTRPRLALVSFCFTSFPPPRYLCLLIFLNNSSLDSPSEFGKRLWTTLGHLVPIIILYHPPTLTLL